MMRGHSVLDRPDRITVPRRRFAEPPIAVRGKTFGSVQDVAGELQLEDLALRFGWCRTNRGYWRTRRGIAGPRSGCSSASFISATAACAAPASSRRLLFTSLGPISGRPHLFLDPLLEVGA
jgi:hypothetical protein